MSNKSATPADLPVLAHLYEKGDDTFRRMADEAAPVIATGGWELLGKRMADHSDFLLNHVILDTCISLKADGWQHSAANYWPLTKDGAYLTLTVLNNGGNNIALPVYRLSVNKGTLTADVCQTIQITPKDIAAEIGITLERMLIGEPTNKERAARIDTALEGYFSARGDSPDETESDIADMLADIMHYCRRKGETFQDLLERATMNFEAEVNEPEDKDGR